MADITQPTFAISVSLADNVLTFTEDTDYVGAGEVSTDYYTKLFPYKQTTDGATGLTATADNASDNLITSWTVTGAGDSWYQGIMAVALLYGQEVSPGNFNKGDVTYYGSTFYIALDNITGSTDPSLTTGADADFVELTSVLDVDSNGDTYLSFLTYYATVNTRITDALKACLHTERKAMLKNREYNCDCKESDKVRDMHNYLQAAETEFSLGNYLEMQKDIEKATEICESC